MGIVSTKQRGPWGWTVESVFHKLFPLMWRINFLEATPLVFRIALEIRNSIYCLFKFSCYHTTSPHSLCECPKTQKSVTLGGSGNLQQALNYSLLQSLGWNTWRSPPKPWRHNGLMRNLPPTSLNLSPWGRHHAFPEKDNSSRSWYLLDQLWFNTTAHTVQGTQD